MMSSCDKFEKAIAPDKKLDQPNLTIEEIKRLILLDTNYTYPQTQALNDAKIIAAQFDREDKLNPAPRTIKQTLVVNVPDMAYPQNSNKKAYAESVNVPEVYVFNYSDNRGFSIISADKRVLGILGSSSGGTIDSLLVNTGLRMFLTESIPYIQKKREEVELLRDSIFDGLVTKLNGDNVKNTKGTSGGRIDDVIHSCSGTTAKVLSTAIIGVTYVSDALVKTQWDQNPPYNNNFTAYVCTTSSPYCGTTNTNFLAGCVPISESQIVAHFYAKRDLTWNRIVNAPNGLACNQKFFDKW
jgi:Spi protease inhibitor